MIRTIFASGVVVLLAAIPQPLVAAPADEDGTIVEGREIYRERVSFADLDLRKGSDRNRLRWRVKAASERVCDRAFGPNRDYGVAGYSRTDPGLTCADVTYIAARPQIRVAIEMAKAGKQPTLAFLVSAPRPAR